MAKDADPAGKGAAPGFVSRIGAAIASPAAALRSADADENAGRAPTDIALLLFALFVAVNFETVVKGVYLAFHGEVGGGLQTIVSRVAADLQWPLVLLLGGFAVITAAGGRRRDLGRDSDLACVAFVPVVLVFSIAALWQRFAANLGETGRLVVFAVALAWFAVGAWFAIKQVRSRPVDA